jgi:hypothetical protein
VVLSAALPAVAGFRLPASGFFTGFFEFPSRTTPGVFGLPSMLGKSPGPGIC